MGLSLAEQIALLSPEERELALAGLDPQELLWDWDFNGRPEQIPPKDNSWNVSLFLAGRGAGKTRAAAEWIRSKAKETPAGEPYRFLLVARTAADVREVLVEGEALSLNTLVPSPQAPGGFTTMGKLKRGHIIIGGNGEPCKVKRAFDVLYDRPCYNVFIEGHEAPVVADANHKWLVRRRVGNHHFSRFRPDFEVKTTEEIFNDNPTQYYIERSIVKGSDNLKPPYDPYEYGKMLTSMPAARNYTNWGAKNRSMADEYLWVSEEARERLLLGMLDGRRGTTRHGGSQKSIPVTKYPKLQAQAARIAASLGYRVGEYEAQDTFIRGGGPRTYTRLTTRWSHEKPKWHRFLAIEPTESVPVRCIEVDSPDHTFLITDRFIKTHNSGIMSVTPPSERPNYQPSIRRLTWPNGNQAFCTSADEPDSLRGVQAHYAWGDEVAAWRQTPDGAGMTAWDNLRVATRLGSHPQIMATTTPKRVPLLYKLLKESEEKGTVWVTRGSTFDNVGNLAGAYLDNIMGTYEGTPLAAQELFGEMLDQNDGALWSDNMLQNAWEPDGLPRYTPLRMVGVDPSVAQNPNDECGIVVVGSTSEYALHERHAWLLEDASMKGPPSAWAQEVVRMARKWSAPVVVEKNQGHQLLLDAIHNIDPTIPVLGVNSQVGKQIRAEPVSMLYWQGRVHHPGGEEGKFAQLEAQMITWIPEITRKSPDRVDALVHALTALLINPPKGFHTGPVRAKNVADRQIASLQNPARIRGPKHNSSQVYGLNRNAGGTLRLGGVDRKKKKP